jgi:hypothetical protein
VIIISPKIFHRIEGSERAKIGLISVLFSSGSLGLELSLVVPKDPFVLERMGMGIGIGGV